MDIFDVAWNAVKNGWNNIFSNIDNVIICIIKIALIILAAWIIKKFILRVIRKAVNRKIEKKPDSLTCKKKETLLSIFEHVVRYVILFIAVTAILSVLGLGSTVTSLLTTAGIGGVAIGLGAQSLVSDMVSGFFVLVDDEYAVGDYVKIGEYKGNVESITMRTTRLKADNLETIIIPNGKVSEVVNYTRDSYLLFADIFVAVEANAYEAGEVMLNTARKYAKEHDFVYGEPAFLGIVDVTPAGQRLRLSIKLEPLQQWQAERSLKLEFMKAFKENNIPLPNMKEVTVFNVK